MIILTVDQLFALCPVVVTSSPAVVTFPTTPSTDDEACPAHSSQLYLHARYSHSIALSILPTSHRFLGVVDRFLIPRAFPSVVPGR